MAQITVLLIACVYLQEFWLGCEGVGLLPRSTANSVLRRQRRYNTGVLEELLKGSLERECREETCNLEEAREVFEDNEKTMEFWTLYTDTDHCKPSPCQNGGQCKNDIKSYTCTCLSGFMGTNCEIRMLRMCEMNNGGCMHFCTNTKGKVKCDCAVGYQLAQDGVTCEPKGSVPCGTLGKTMIATHSQRSRPTQRQVSPPGNITQLPAVDKGNKMAPAAIKVVVAVNKPVSAGNKTIAPAKKVTSLGNKNAPLGNNTVITDNKISPLGNKASVQSQPSSKLPTQGTSQVQAVVIPRIMGGNEVTPGEIPWQVALVDRQTKMVFCGGSIISEWWVITAAHCLEGSKETSFFLRVGEHDVNKHEGREQNLDVAKMHPYPLYNTQVNQFNNDIALLWTKTAIQMTEFVRPICLGPMDFTEWLVQDSPMGRVSGWGRLQHQGATSAILRKVDLPFVDRSQCKASNSERVTRHMFCAGYGDQPRDACQGDSGGPHASRRGTTWFLTGIVSWGEECGVEGKYGVYTRVSHYYNWIAQVTQVTGPRKDMPASSMANPLLPTP